MEFHNTTDQESLVYQWLECFLNLEQHTYFLHFSQLYILSPRKW